MGNLCAPAAEDKSANKSGKPEDRSIDYKFEKTGVVEFDNFFSEASQVLQDAESLRSGIEDTKAQGMDQSHASYLVTPHFSDMIQVLLWAASADAGGKIQDTDIQHIPDAPFLNINKKKVSKETYALFQLFEQYVATIMDAPKTLEDMVFKLEDMGEKVIQLMEDAKMDIQNSNLSFTGKLKATAEILKNGAKLPKDLIKCKELRQTIMQAKNDMEELIPKLPGLVLDADVVGAKAAAAKLLKPADIFDKFHPGPKKATPPPPATPSSTPSNTAPNANSNSSPTKPNTNSTTSPTKPNTNSTASPTKPNTNSTASPTKPAASTTQPATSPTKSTNPADAVVAEAIVVSTHATHHAHHHHHHPHNLE